MTEPAPEDLFVCPQIHESEIELLYSVDWWDGPLRGLAKHGERLYWFNFYCDDGNGKDYFYKLHPIPLIEEIDILSWCQEYKERQKKLSLALNNPLMDEAKEALFKVWNTFCSTLPDYETKPWTAWFCSGSNASFYGIQVEKS